MNFEHFPVTLQLSTNIEPASEENANSQLTGSFDDRFLSFIRTSDPFFGSLPKKSFLGAYFYLSATSCKGF